MSKPTSSVESFLLPATEAFIITVTLNLLTLAVILVDAAAKGLSNSKSCSEELSMAATTTSSKAV